MRERRKGARIDLSIKVRYKVLERSWVEDKTLSRNITSEGIQLAVSEKLVKGNMLELEIYLPGEAKPISATGAVVWVREAPEDWRSDFDAGVRIIKMAPSDKDKILRYISGRFF